MSDIGEDVEKERTRIHSEESYDNPLLFMIIPGAVACLEESTRLAGYMMILGAVGQPLIDTATKAYRAIKRYRRN